VEAEQRGVDKGCVLCLKGAVGTVSLTEDVQLWGSASRKNS
jgi:hypothetical protein